MSVNEQPQHEHIHDNNNINHHRHQLQSLPAVDHIEEVYTREYQRLRGLARKSEVFLGYVSVFDV